MSTENTIEIYFNQIQKYKLLNKKEEQELFLKLKNNDIKARAKIVNSNLRLVIKIAKKYLGCGLPLEDLISEGNVGLMYAVERFDVTKGFRFSTYATCWIKHTICRYITEKSHFIRIPSYMKKILLSIKDKKNELVKKGFSPFIEDLMDLLEIKESNREITHKAIITENAIENVKSLESINTEFERIEDNKSLEEQNYFCLNSDLAKILNILKEVNKRGVEIIKLRYGIGKNKPLSIKETALKMKLSKERIRQIEKETLDLIKERLTEYVPAN